MDNLYLLQRNDIFRLERGMNVYASIPEKFLFVNTPFSDKLKEHAICIGETLRKKVPVKGGMIKGLKEIVEAHIHHEVTNEQISNFIDSLNLDFSPEEFDTSVFMGEYRVCEAVWDGGIYDGPDGWHVYCQKVDKPEVTVHFYQTGYFTVINSDIKPINRAV